MLKELRQLWSDLPHKAEAAALIIAWVLLFHFLGNSVLGYVDTRSMFVWLDTLYTNAEKTDSDDAFGRYVPFLVLVLMLVRRDELLAAIKRTWTPGLLLIGGAIVLHAVGFLIQQTRVSLVAFLVGLYGIMGLLWGRDWLRAIFFPYFLLGFSLPVAAYLDGPTFKLRLFSTWVSTHFCTDILSIKLQRIGTMVFFPPTLTKPGFRFEVAAACSGIRSLTVVLLLTLAFAWLNFTSPWRRAVIVLASIPLALLGNIVRLITTFCVAEAWDQEAASWVETKAGFITFSVALAGVFLIGRFLREPGSPSGHGPTDPEPEPEPEPEPRPAPRAS
jgi:exosortase